MEDIKTGDLILFCSKDFTSRLIRTLSYSRWSHVGIAIRIQGSPKDFKVVNSEGNLYVMEMILDDYDQDFLTETKKQHFRLTPIELRMKKDYSVIAYRSLNKSLSKKQLEKTKKFILEHKDSKFYKSEFSLFKLWLGLDPDSKDDAGKDRYCCTTIASKFLNQVAKIPIKFNVIPTSFESKDCDHHGFILRDFFSNEKVFWINHEEWHDSVGFMLGFLLVWLIFWWITAEWFFKPKG